MNQIKTFTATSTHSLDENVNSWLDKNAYNDIVGDIRFSTSAATTADGFLREVYAAQITYTPKR